MLFGFAGLYGKIIDAPSIVIVWGRVIFATIVLFFFLSDSDRKLQSFSSYTKMAFLGVLLSLHWLTFFESIKLSTVGVGLISFSTFPAFVILYESVFRGYSIKIDDLLIILLILFGVFLLIPDYNLGDDIFAGILFGLVSAITFAVLTIKNKDYLPKFGGIVLAYYQYFFAALIISPILIFVDFSVSTLDLLNLVILGAVFTALGHTLFIKSLKIISPQKASIIACMEPVYGILFALFLLGEIPKLRVIAGGIVIIGAIVFSTIRKK